MPAKKKASDKDPQVAEAVKRTLVFLDVAVAADSELSHLGRMVFELSIATHPRTTANFKALCTGTQLPAAEGKGAGKSKDTRLYSFLETRFSRITEDGIQGGAVHSGTVDLKEYDFKPLEGFGSAAAEAAAAPPPGARAPSAAPGGSQKSKVLDSAPNENSCIYGKEFEDENLGALPFAYGSLGMCNSGPNTNGSQFFICVSKPHPTDFDETQARTRHLNTHHTCFGTLVSGKQVLEELQARMAAMVTDDVGLMPLPNYEAPQFVVVGCGSLSEASLTD